MKNQEASIITYGTSLSTSVNHAALYLHTQHSEPASIRRFNWDTVAELHILSSNGKTRSSEIPKGIYYNSEKTWVLVIGATSNQLETILSAPRSKLKHLDLRFSKIKNLDVGKMEQLEKLCISDCECINGIQGLDHLSRLSELDLSFTNLDAMPKLHDGCTLKRLDLSGNLMLTDVDLSGFTQLEELDLSGTNIGPVLELSNLEKLKRLRLTDARNLHQLSGLYALAHLEYLDLSCSGMKHIPEDVSALKKLIRLDFSHMKLQSVPEHLFDPPMPLPFSACSEGINLRKTYIPDFDTDVFDGDQSDEPISREKIQQKFDEYRNKTPRPLKQAKVIFLGNGGAGKTHTIERIIHGGKVLNHEITTTPGIMVSPHLCQINGYNIHVNYWDFGGQDQFSPIYHPFLTHDALYIVVLNPASELYKQARHWLDTIKFYATGTKGHCLPPVLMIVNKIDLYKNTNLDERTLQEEYGGDIQFIKMSAMTDSEGDIQDKLILKIKEKLFDMIAARPLLEPSCHQYFDQLQQKEETLLTLSDYKIQSATLGMDEADQTNLLSQLHNLGMICWYGEHEELKDRIICDPNWLTNALCTIAFNRDILLKQNQGSSAGFISHDSLRWLLDPMQAKSNTIKRLLPDQQYIGKDLDYVLNIMRQFNLSSEIESGIEFIPMLCQGDTPNELLAFENEPDVVKYRLTYTNLLDSVIHRLMVYRKDDIQRKNCWLTGAQFIDKSRNATAVVKKNDLTIELLIQEPKPTDDTPRYSKILLDELKRISEDLDMKIQTTEILYRYNNIDEYFDLDMISGSMDSGIDSTYSKGHKRAFKISDILSANPDPEDVTSNKQ